MKAPVLQLKKYEKPVYQKQPSFERFALKCCKSSASACNATGGAHNQSNVGQS
jgi:hypothetical protein